MCVCACGTNEEREGRQEGRKEEGREGRERGGGGGGEKMKLGRSDGI